MYLRNTVRIVLSLLIVSACASTEPSDSGVLRFSALIYGYDGKQGTPQPGDSAGFYIQAPVSVCNRKAVYASNGYISLTSPIAYPEGLAEDCAVCACLPYRSGLADESPVFAVENDQRTLQSHAGSCLYTATGAIKPDSRSAIKMEFRPQMALLSIHIENLTGKAITSVCVRDVYGAAKINLLDGSISATGEKGDLTAYGCPDSSGVYHLYLAPQKAGPEVAVTLDDGATKIFSYDSELDLLPGRVSSNASEAFMIEEIGPIDTDDFKKYTIPGVYNLGEEKVTPIFQYRKGSDQYAMSSSETSKEFRIMNIEEGLLLRVTASGAMQEIGAAVRVKTETVGFTDLVSGTYDTTIEKISDNCVWLSDKISRTGFIICVK